MDPPKHLSSKANLNACESAVKVTESWRGKREGGRGRGAISRLPWKR